jgi:hypothetical protein
MAKKKKFSMRPEAAEEGLFGNCEATVVKAFYGTYGEHAPENLTKARTNGSPEDPTAVIEFEVEGQEENATQFFGCGSVTKLVPSEDGEEAASEGPFLARAEGSNAGGLNKQTGMYHFLHSLSKPAEGKLKFNSAILDEKGLDALVGLRGFFVRVPAPRVSSVAMEEGARPSTILICQEIYELPKGSKVARSKKDEDEDEDEAPKKRKTKPTEEEEEEESDPVVEEAQVIVVKALEKAGEDGIVKDKLPGKILVAATKSKHRKQILELVQDDDFLSEGPWNYDEDEEKLTSLEE